MAKRYRASGKRPRVTVKKRLWPARLGRIMVLLWSASLAGLFAFANGDEGLFADRSASTEAGAQVTQTVASPAAVPELPPEIPLDEMAAAFEYSDGDKGLQNGRGIAYVNSTAHMVDEKGRLLRNGAQYGSEDLPVITCENVAIDSKKMRLSTAELYESLEFLALLRKKSLPFYYRVSQIHLDPEVGAVLYFEGTMLPTIIGRGHIKRKVAYLATVLTHMGGEQELSKIKYFDLRLEGQVIAKLNDQGDSPFATW